MTRVFFGAKTPLNDIKYNQVRTKSTLFSSLFSRHDETPLTGEMGEAQRGGLSSLRGGIVPYVSYQPAVMTRGFFGAKTPLNDIKYNQVRTKSTLFSSLFSLLYSLNQYPLSSIRMALHGDASNPASLSGNADSV